MVLMTKKHQKITHAISLLPNLRVVTWSRFKRYRYSTVLLLIFMRVLF